MRKSIVKLVAALSMVLAFVGCTIEITDATYSLNYNYFYTSYCADDSDPSSCEDLGEGSYVRVGGDLNYNAVVTIEMYLPGDDDPYYEEDFYYEGRLSDRDGTYEYFKAVSGGDRVLVYDDDFASLEGAAGWSYNFSNDVDLYKKRAK